MVWKKSDKLIILNTEKKLKTLNQKTYGKCGKICFDV